MHVGHEHSNSSSTNGTSTNGTITNGSSRGKARATASNGFTNGDGLIHTNGADGRPQVYRGHDRHEVVRLMMQTLQDMGYEGAAATLEAESGVELESPSVAALRYAVLNGEWNDAEMLLLGSSSESTEQPLALSAAGLPLKTGVDRNDIRFVIRRQKYLELLEQRDHGRALMVLRHGLTPLTPPFHHLQDLSGLMVCPTVDELKRQSAWQGAHGGSRQQLLEELSQSIHHSVIVPPNRLTALLTQTQKSWIRDCVWHNPIEPISLFIDHACDKDQFPLHSVHTIVMNDEVYHLAFSHDGRYLAAAGKEKAAVIYEVGGDWEIKHRCGDHTDDVGYVAWSPDDKLLVTCSRDRSAKLWDTATGACIVTLAQFSEAVSAAVWLPDGSGFVTASMDIRNPLLVWRVEDLLRKSTKPSLVFPTKNLRVQDITVTPDGSKILAINASEDDSTGHLSVFDLRGIDHDELFRLRFDAALTSVNISQDGRHALVSLADKKIQCIDITTMDVVQRYSGQTQGTYVIKSIFGGADENLVISGSEDGKIYVFHRDRGSLIEILDGHTNGYGSSTCANAVAWNSGDHCMFASCGDDAQIRIWSKSNAYTPATSRRTSSDLSIAQEGARRLDMTTLGRRDPRLDTTATPSTVATLL